MKISLCLFLTLSLFTGHCLFAQEINLDPVTVTSSMLEKRASETGRNIAVIRGDEIRKLPVNSIDELLRYLPGLEVQARGPMGTQSDIVLRGGTFQQVLVVLDGLRLNDPNTGHFNSYIPISPSEIERIEILKGASSSLYGSEAVGGVVSVITKTFAAGTKESSDSYSVEGTGVGGSYGLVNGRIGAHLVRNRLSVAGGVSSNNADGEQQRGTRGYFHNHTASVSAGYRFSERWSAGYRVSFDKRDFSAQNFYTTFVSDTASEQVTAWWNQLHLTYAHNRTTLQLKGGYKQTKDHYLYNASSLPNDNTSSLWQGLLTWQERMGENTDLVAGLNYQQKEIASNDRGNHSLQQLAPFISLSRRFGAFTIHPSVRLDWRQHIGTELVPMLNASYKLDNWQLRASIGKTIRDADFTERYNNYGKKLVTGGSVGNPGLKAERSLSYEVGADWFWNSRLKISATGFRREQDNLIDYVPTPYNEMPRKDNLSPTGTFALAQNIASVTTEGVETDVQFEHQWDGGHRLRTTFGLTLLRSSGAGQLPSFYISSHARILTNLACSYRYRRISASFNGLYKKREARRANGLETRITPDYLVLNVQAGYDVLQDRLTVFLQCDNLTGTRYSDLLGAVMPGRWLMGGIKFRL